ncbi:MAG: hypothetical protein Q4G53_05850 [Clostridia bacterium]|nr:hypothetical protein [Clostridia bacterium]
MSDGQNLSNAVDMLKNMLGSEEGQQQIQGIVSMLGGESSGNAQSESSENSENSENKPSNFNADDAEMMMKLQKVMSAVKSAENGREAAFLRALAPLLRPERRDKLNNAVKILGMSRAIKIFKDI